MHVSVYSVCRDLYLPVCRTFVMSDDCTIQCFSPDIFIQHCV